MENAEVATSFDGGDGFGANAQYHLGNHKKALFADSSCDGNLDSGYASNFSISQNHITTNSSKLANITNSPRRSSSASFKKSIDLQTINENYELQSSLNATETPTTRSIRQLSEFHIQTPQNAKNISETTPTKSNYFNVPNSGPRSGRKKNRSRLQWSPYQNSPTKRKSDPMTIKSPSNRCTLNSEFDLNDENDAENLESIYDRSIGFSPINPHNLSNAVTQENVSKRTLQRHPSGIESSTPKLTNFRRTQTQSNVKRNEEEKIINYPSGFLRKTQSFSPAKRGASILKETNYRNRSNREEVLIEHDETEAPNPARKVLAFSGPQFVRLLHTKSPPAKPNLRSNANDSQTSMKKSWQSPRKQNQSRLIKEFSRKKSIKPTTSTLVESFNESDVLMSLANKDEPTLDQQSMDVSNNADAINSTPSSQVDLFSNFAGTPMRNNVTEKSLLDEANRTPVKRLERSFSYNPAPKTSSPEKEMNEILRRLPCTPPKKYNRKPLKRQASVLSDSVTNEPAAKRRLYETFKRPPPIDGQEKVDILWHLTKIGDNFSVKRILNSLDDKDLQSVYCVSQAWRKAVKTDSKLDVRRRKYVRIARSVKENAFRRETKVQLRDRNHNNENITNELNKKRKPFNVCNDRNVVQSEDVPRSPPASPSTRKFRENQKVRTLEHLLNDNFHLFLFIHLIWVK